MNYDEQKQAVKDAAGAFPATFGLRAFPGDVFRISLTASYVNDADEVTLCTQIEKQGVWLSFAKGTVDELQAEVLIPLVDRSEKMNIFALARQWDMGPATLADCVMRTTPYLRMELTRSGATIDVWRIGGGFFRHRITHTESRDIWCGEDYPTARDAFEAAFVVLGQGA